MLGARKGVAICEPVKSGTSLGFLHSFYYSPTLGLAHGPSVTPGQCGDLIMLSRALLTHPPAPAPPPPGVARRSCPWRGTSRWQ
jgi:hypothetical protein